MGQAIEQLRQALASDEEPTLRSIGGPQAILAAADELPSAAELPVVVSLAVAEWSSVPDRAGLVDLIDMAVHVARPFELDDMLDVVLSSESVVPELAPRIEITLRNRAAGDDAAAGIALEAWLRLSLGQWVRPLPLLGRLDEHASTAADAEPYAIDPTFLQRLVRCLGAAGEYWRAHSAEMAAALSGLLHHTDVEDNVAFELGMLELRAALETADPEKSLTALTEARAHLALAAHYEDRVDAEIFGAAIDALIAFVNGAVPTPRELDRLNELVVEYRRNTLAEHPHWRQPRADTAVQWLGLVDTLTQLQDLDHSWYEPAELIKGIAAVYQAHRTFTLIQAANVHVRRPEATAPVDSVALPALVQPRLVAAVASRSDGLGLLERWLAAVAETSTSQGDADAIRDIRDRVRAGGPPDDPKVASADVSALTDLLRLPTPDALALATALGRHPDIARRLNHAASAIADANAVDTTIYFQQQFDRVRRDLRMASELTDERALRVEQVALALMRYMRWRGSVTAGSKFAASFQRTFTNHDDAPKEAEFADDLHLYLAMILPLTPYKEVSHVANGRVDLICHFGVISLVIECKRELNDASMDHLASLYAFQAAEYDWADPGVAFLAVLDLTKQTRRVPLGEAVSVVQIPPVEDDGRPETVMVAKIQANLPSPSHQSTRGAVKARTTAGIRPTAISSPQP